MRRLWMVGLGWLLVVGGVVLYPLPGPGLLLIALGVPLLARYDERAARWLRPAQRRALRETARAVETWPRTLVSALVTALVGLAGVLWLLEPAQPAWWGLPAWTWLPGGWWAGVSQVASGVVCLALVAWARVVLGPGRAPASALGLGELREESRRSAA